MATSIVFGALLLALSRRTRHVVVIPPGGNGARPVELYPEPLRPTRGTGAGTDKLRHERAAYDVAIAGPATRRFAAARGTIYG